MGTAKPVRLSNGRVFARVKDAQDFYRAILGRVEIGELLTGDDRGEIDVLYRDYCAITNWQMPGRPVSYRADWSVGKGFSTKCFWVEFDMGGETEFSFIQAVREIATR